MCTPLYQGQPGSSTMPNSFFLAVCSSSISIISPLLVPTWNAQLSRIPQMTQFLTQHMEFLFSRSKSVFFLKPTPI